MDQSNRYADLSLREDELIRGGRHILVAYKMKPKAGTGYLEAAAHFAAESSTGTNVEVSTTDEFTKGVDALVYLIDEATEEMRIAYPLDLFDRNIIDGRMMMVSFLTLAIGNNRAWATSSTRRCTTSMCRHAPCNCSMGRVRTSRTCGASLAGQ